MWVDLLPSSQLYVLKFARGLDPSYDPYASILLT